MSSFWSPQTPKILFQAVQYFLLTIPIFTVNIALLNVMHMYVNDEDHVNSYNVNDEDHVNSYNVNEDHFVSKI